MADQSDGGTDIEPFGGREVVDSLIQSRLNDVQRSYDRAITSLWLGNGSATLAILSVIADDKTNYEKLFYALAFFILGLILMGFGEALSLIKARQVIKSLEKAQSILDIKIGDIPAPLERSGLTWSNPRTFTAFVSAGCFILGCAIGLYHIWIAI